MLPGAGLGHSAARYPLARGIVDFLLNQIIPAGHYIDINLIWFNIIGAETDGPGLHREPASGYRQKVATI